VGIFGAWFAIRRVGLWKLLSVVALFLFFGILYCRIFENAVVAETHLVFDKKIDLTAIVTDESQPSMKVLIVHAEAQSPFTGSITLLAPPQSVIQYGDLLRISGKISPPKTAGDDPLAYLPAITIVGRHRASWTREKLIDLKHAALAMFERTLPRDEAGLLGGIAFGSKVDLSAGLKQALAGSGTTHLVAVSGYNITIVLYAVEKMLSRFLMRSQMLVIALMAVALFVVMTGLQPSAIRAAIMGCIVIFAGEMGGQADLDARNALTLTALGMSLFDPTLPARNLGFQLSFLSLAGIIYLEAPLRRMFRMKTEGIFGWKASVATTLAAQLAVMPLLSATFGGFSATAIFANVMVLGTVPPTMFFGFMLAMTGAISHYLAFSLAEVVHILLAYQIGTIKFWSGLAIPIPIPFGTWLVPLVYYGGLAWLTFRFTDRAGPLDHTEIITKKEIPIAMP
jgi:competence protein ComEC